jgi:cell division protein FtsQ
MALWQRNQQFFVVDQEGIVIQDASVEDYDYLPLIVGEMTPDKTATFLSELVHIPSLEGRIQAATLVDGRRWNLRLEHNVDAYLPEEGLEQSLQRLTTLIEQDHILDRNIRSIDLRHPTKTILRLGEGISLRSREPARAT